jgi:hypothetical protein
MLLTKNMFRSSGSTSSRMGMLYAHDVLLDDAEQEDGGVV